MELQMELLRPYAPGSAGVLAWRLGPGHGPARHRRRRGASEGGVGVRGAGLATHGSRLPGRPGGCPERGQRTAYGIPRDWPASQIWTLDAAADAARGPR